MRWAVQVDGMDVTVRGVPLSAGLHADLLQRIPGSVVSEVYEDSLQGTAQRSLQCLSDIVYLEDVDELELRRRILALLARAAVRRGAAIIHASVVSDGANAIVLLGGYGAGKTSVAVTLATQGWQHLAGDACLITTLGEVRAGSRVVLTRTPVSDASIATTLQLPLGESRWEAARCHGGPYSGIRVRTVAVLDVRRPFAAPKVLTTSELSAALFAAARRIFSRRASHWGEQLFDAAALHELRATLDPLATQVTAIGLMGDSRLAAEFLCTTTVAGAAEEHLLRLDGALRQDSAGFNHDSQ